MVSAAIVLFGSLSTLLGGGVSDSLHHLSSRWTFPRNARSVYRCIYVYFVIHIARISCTRLIKPENKSRHAQGSAWRDMGKACHPPLPRCSLFNQDFEENHHINTTETSWRQQDGYWLTPDNTRINKCKPLIKLWTWSTQPMGKQGRGISKGENTVQKLSLSP